MVGAVLRGRLGTVSSALVSPLTCPYAWDDLVVSPGIGRQLREIESQVRLAGAVLDDWGLRRLTPASRGMAALFAGPSGTGKTMAAQVLARELDVDLFRVDLAEVVNKYIGETEKRLAQVFDECERTNVMILFDEADALFGQRTQVRDAHDRFANIEIDYLLAADGDLRRGRDPRDQPQGRPRQRVRQAPARHRRLPAAGTRRAAALWRLALPRDGCRRIRAESRHRPPVSSPTASTLTGAEIKAIALAAAFAARARNGLIDHDDVLAAARREIAKRGDILRETTGPTANGHAVLVAGGAR